MSSENPSTFLTRLNEMMQERGMSREFLMRNVSGIGPLRLSQLFEDEWLPSLYMRRRIASLLECSLTYLMGETDDPNQIDDEDPAPFLVEHSWSGFYRWLTDRRFMGRKPPWEPGGRVCVANIPSWMHALDLSEDEDWEGGSCLTNLTDLEIQIICNWIRHRSARKHRPSMSLFSPKPQVIQFEQARARLRPGQGS